MSGSVTPEALGDGSYCSRYQWIQFRQLQQNCLSIWQRFDESIMERKWTGLADRHIILLVSFGATILGSFRVAVAEKSPGWIQVLRKIIPNHKVNNIIANLSEMFRTQFSSAAVSSVTTLQRPTSWSAYKKKLHNHNLPWRTELIDGKKFCNTKNRLGLFHYSSCTSAKWIFNKENIYLLNWSDRAYH